MTTPIRSGSCDIPITDMEFRKIVCNITSLKPDDPIFDEINEVEIRIIKASSSAIEVKNKIDRLRNEKK